jgi:hypothetical protein
MNATAIVTPAADTHATANRAVWTIGSSTVVVSRRRISGGRIRIRVEVRRHHVPSAQTAHTFYDFRDLPAREANALFTTTLLKWNAAYRQSLPAWAEGSANAA